jgi:Ca-activated chloride channel homolog
MRPSQRLLLLISAFLLTCLSGISWDNRKILPPVFKIGVDTVFLHVSVFDGLERNVSGLSRDDFKVYEDKVEQEISTFTHDHAPLSIGILLDRSGSMKAHNNIRAAIAAIRDFMSQVQSGDEFFLIAFNQNASLVKDFTDDSSAIVNEGALLKPSGQTAIWDAVYMGLSKMKSAKNERKALILVTDGEDNSSRYTCSEVKEFAKESGTPIYAIGEPGEMGYGPAEITSIVQITGGRAFFPDTLNALDYYITLVNAELRNQYLIGYVPSHSIHDGKWRKIQVRLEELRGLPKLVVRTREGYYSPKN